MLKNLYFLIFVIAIASGCADDCTTTQKYLTYEPVYQTTAAVREALNFSTVPRDINTPGRLYFKDGYMYINEIGEGIHVIDNRNPAIPQKIGFVTIPGNFDLAAKGNYLYADSYVDLVVLDISDPTDIREVNRMETVFGDYGIWAGRFDATSQVILTEYNEMWVEQEIDTDCDDNNVWLGRAPFAEDQVVQLRGATSSFANTSSASGNVGIGGSMARFTIYDKFLYTVDFSDMRLFDLSEATAPEKTNTIPLGWDIETIFPYGDKLFIGARNGMHIYDNANPESPVRLSTYQHVQSCDPVVVRDDYAFVTLRSGSECQGFINQLDVVDITDLRDPTLLKTYEMSNPHGLGVNGDCLFITEGEFGLRYLDAADVNDISEVGFIDGLHSIDVIALDEVLMVIGNDGFHQYSYNCDDKSWTYLSSLAIAQL
ncbi:MAG: hypothetical protein AAGA85_09070 [Bacteroidota bacterium]